MFKYIGLFSLAFFLVLRTLQINFLVLTPFSATVCHQCQEQFSHFNNNVRTRKCIFFLFWLEKIQDIESRKLNEPIIILEIWNTRSWKFRKIVTWHIKPHYISSLHRCSYQKMSWKYAGNFLENTHGEMRFQ